MRGKWNRRGAAIAVWFVPMMGFMIITVLTARACLFAAMTP
jgi:hypothetical protein